MVDKPIIKIPIDASAFEKFYELFQKYSEELKEQPEAWAKLNDAMTAGQKAAQAAQKKGSLAGGSDSAASIAKSLDAATRATKALTIETKKSDTAMASLLRNTAGVAGGLFEASAGISGIKKVLTAFGPLGKLAGISLAAGAALGDLALRSAGSVSNTARAAYGANLSYGAYQNATSALSQFVPNPSGLLQTVAAAQFNPAAYGYLSLFGANNAESTTSAASTIIQGGVTALRQTHNLMVPQVKYAETLTGLSDNDFISLMNQNPKNLNKAIQDMLNPALAKSQDVNQPTISSDQRTATLWARSMNEASAKFAQALAPMNPIVNAFGQDVASFAGAVNRMVQATGGAATALGAASGAGGVPGWIKALPSWMQPVGSSTGESGAVNPQTSRTNFAAVMKGFEAAGYSTNFSAAMAAQASSESNFDSGATNTTGGQTHKGLFQWSATRRGQIMAGTGIDVWNDLSPSDQIKAAVWELHNTQKSAAAQIAEASLLGPQYAARAADNYFERSGDGQLGQSVRALKSDIYATVGPKNNGVSPQVASLLKKLAQQRIIKPVNVTVTNSTSSKVAVSANAAAY